MAQLFEAGILNMLDENNVYHPMLAIKGDKGDPGPVASEEVIRRVTSEEVAKVVAEAPEDFDTLKEISDWIATHQEDASAMNTAILQNAADIATNASAITSLGTAVGGLETDVAAIEDKLAIAVSGTLTAGDTSIELLSDSITASSIIEPYFYVEYGSEVKPISYSTIEVETGKVTMTFDALESDLTVGIKVV